jgi:Ca2+-binding EF-hand superfamily protein
MNRSALVMIVALAVPGAASAQLDPNRFLADADHDGKVSRAEYQASRSKFLMRADHNKDGKISAAEWTKGAATLRAQYRDEGVDGTDLIGKAGLFPKIDTDKDGFVSTAEINAASNHQFGVYDGNKDGQVTRGEARAAMTKARVR